MRAHADHPKSDDKDAAKSDGIQHSRFLEAFVDVRSMVYKQSPQRRECLRFWRSVYAVLCGHVGRVWS